MVRIYECVYLSRRAYNKKKVTIFFIAIAQQCPFWHTEKNNRIVSITLNFLSLFFLLLCPMSLKVRIPLARDVAQ